MLNEIQIRVLNSLMDDDESIETIKSMLTNIDNFNTDNVKIIEALMFLFENKYIVYIESVYDEQKRQYYPKNVECLDMTKILEYWFRILDKGRDEVNKESYNKYFPES